MEPARVRGVDHQVLLPLCAVALLDQRPGVVEELDGGRSLQLGIERRRGGRAFRHGTDLLSRGLFALEA
jgi:hypothetical protein